MRFFIDTAKVEDIKKANDMGVICGVTTNPSLIAKEGRDFKEVIKEITSIVDGPISGEVKATTVDAEGMIAEGREIAEIHSNMVVKIPMTVEGLKACKVLTAEGIKTNVTLIFTANQALLAARAGATYVSPFLGRLDDISTLIFFFASVLNNLNALPGASLIPITEIRSASLSRATPLINILSIFFTTSLTTVPSDSFRLERTTSGTPYFFAISTDRLCNTPAPRVARSSISS